MSLRYLYQIVLCSQREGRVYRREIAISETEAMVTKAEAMPPGYHNPLHENRPGDEEVLRFDMPLKKSRAYKGCPLCGQTWVVECTCGALSCSSGQSDHHHCPGCKRIFDVQDADHFKASASGWVHPPMNAPVKYRPVPNPRKRTGIVPSAPQRWEPIPNPRRRENNPPPPGPDSPGRSAQKLLGTGDRSALRRWLAERNDEE